MRASLELQRSLFRKQRALISRAVVGKSPAFKRYEQRYRRATRGYQRLLTAAQVNAAVAAADVVYVGDYHTLHVAQEGFLALARAAAKQGRRLVIALEFVEGRHQASLDAWLQGTLKDAEFLAAIGHPYRGPFDIWPNFQPLLSWARDGGHQVLAIDSRAQGPEALARRDKYAAARIARAAAAEDRPLVLVLVGQFHVAPGHLPAQVDAALGRVERKKLVVYQNAEDIYWRLAQEGVAGHAHAALVRPGEICLVTASPVVCQQSFLDYVDSEAGDEPLPSQGAAGAFAELARRIARLLDIDVEKPLREVKVVTAQDLDLVDQLIERGRFDKRELLRLERHVLSRESAYVPRARLAYLARSSLNHVAEEATHFVRHVAVQDAMDAPRPLADAFWARCLEEALGFFGSRLLNPARKCPQLADFADSFSTRGAQRETAAFVLALKAAECDGPAACRPLLPLSDEAQFHAVSHALGYLLGEALHHAFEHGRFEALEVRSLFYDPFRHAEGRYFALAARLFGTRR